MDLRRDITAGSTATVSTAITDTLQPTFPWIDGIKGLAILWIITNHFVEATIDCPFLGNPSAVWPPLSERIEQLWPVAIAGIWSLPVNLIRYIGWLGDQGVGLFLILSGFGLSWGMLNRCSKEISLSKFYFRRFLRIFPLWWAAHIFFLFTGILAGVGLKATSVQTALSFLGIRFTPDLMYYFAPAWWFVPLLIQLYLIFPLLWRMGARWGVVRVAVIAGLVGLAARACGFLYFQQYLDNWSRGAIFITRLPEFCLGIVLAQRFYADRMGIERLFRSPGVVGAALLTYLAGNALSLTLPGMVIAPFILGLSGVMLAYMLLALFRADRLFARVLQWIGKHSYSIFLIHQPIISGVIRVKRLESPFSVLLAVAVVVVVTLAVALVLERVTDGTIKALSRKSMRKRIAAGFASAALVFGLALYAGEWFVRTRMPQEVLGWGERPSLVQDSLLGYKLKPSSTTRLRWESYDYVVTSNSLGFPGPEYSVDKPGNVFRILVTGDAFSSAEGVNTNDAWPRLLESDLSGPAKNSGQTIQVLNFAITGYGPNEYAKVVCTYVPVFKPDVVLAEFFVNDFDDVCRKESIVKSIGFGLPPSDGWYSFLTLAHLRSYLDHWVKMPLRSRFLNRPAWFGYALGNFAVLERGRIHPDSTSSRLLTDRVREMSRICNANNARLVFVIVPASVQVCGHEDLAYYPANISLADTVRFQVDQPQRVLAKICHDNGIEYFDLLPVLRAVPGGCPYQPKNMHWTKSAHAHVAHFLAKEIAALGIWGQARGKSSQVQ